MNLIIRKFAKLGDPCPMFITLDDVSYEMAVTIHDLFTRLKIPTIHGTA